MNKGKLYENPNTMEQLQINVVTWSLVSTRMISDAWPTITGGEQTSSQSNLIVRTEMLWFLLHMLNRVALQAGGPEVMTTLREAIARKAVQSVIVAFVDLSALEDWDEARKWEERLTDEAMAALEESENDYSYCNELIDENNSLNEDTIIGKLCARIARQVDYNSRAFREYITSAASDALIKSEMKQLIGKICNIWPQ